MSSSVCQGLQSCLEPRRLGPSAPMLTLAPPKSHSSRSFSLPLPRRFDSGSSHEEPQQLPPHEDAAPATTNTGSVDLESWKFLLGSVKTTNYCEDSKTCIPPPVEHSSYSLLSQKSLEMCTESLGSETGSDCGEEIYLKSLDTRNILPAKEQPKLTRENFLTKKLNRAKSFPPPLSSIREFGGFQVRSHREGGRLVIRAASASSYYLHFHVERSDGRLRLRLIKDGRELIEQEVVLQEKEGSTEDDNGCITESELNGDVNVDTISGFSRYEEKLKEEEVVEEEGVVKSEENKGGSVGFVGGESGRREFSSKARRCHESGQGNKGLLKWEPFLLAT